ncbi:hypothetical protein ABMA27_015545 [Loxostege sticticalis]|uniref:Secreted protein n=1 Tax=Loxostege sticticalis TaxID=481309 RepID=A0ABR3I830_LOXSC
MYTYLIQHNYLLLASVVAAASAWSLPYYPVHRAPPRVVRYAPPPPHFRPQIRPEPTDEQWERPKRNHHDYEDHDHHDHDHEHRDTRGVTGPVHTFVKTDKNANYKWGVRHHVGNKYAS